MPVAKIVVISADSLVYHVAVTMLVHIFLHQPAVGTIPSVTAVFSVIFVRAVKPVMAIVFPVWFVVSIPVTIIPVIMPEMSLVMVMLFVPFVWSVVTIAFSIVGISDVYPDETAEYRTYKG